jgi:hypothetical protein
LAWRRLRNERKLAAGLCGILVYFLFLSHHGLRTYFTNDDVMNLVSLHGYWRWPWWRNALEAVMIVTPTYRPMGDVFYRFLYTVFDFHPLPFRLACYALMLVNLGLFFRLAFLLSHCREVALVAALIFSFHAALGSLYSNTGTVYDILCVFFTLGALIRYASVRGSGRELRARDVVIVLLLYGGALDSKEMAASLPLALVLYESILGRHFGGRFWRRALPLLLAGILTVAALAAKVPVLSENPLYQPQRSPAYLLHNASHYVGMLVFREQPFGTIWFIVLVALASTICPAARRPVALFGLSYGLVALLPIVPVPARDGFVLYLPLVGFALFSGDLLVAAWQAAQRFLPMSVRKPFWMSLGQTSLFVALAAGLYVIHSLHWHDPSQDTDGEDAAMRKTVGLVQAALPTLPVGTRLFFLDDPLPKNRFTLPLLIQAAYHDPSLSVARQNNAATPIEPAEYAIFDYAVSIRDGQWKAQRLPPIRWEGPVVPVTFVPGTIRPGQSMRMRVGAYTDAAVDIEYRSTFHFATDTGIALRWASLSADGIATIPISRIQDPVSIQITAVKVGGDVWRQAQGGFIVR